MIKIKLFDVIEIPGKNWHQFHASKNKALGFLCLVNIDRDRPERPDEKTLIELRQNHIIDNFIKV